ncbi:hypothetical protein [Acinetobacter shaoyimingii]|uniref:Lipoprotein n=1 Tax=Acinetobacter shaoyimingii TaxID=2715164 RepID=A0A6G8RVC3_9GAMM|nr:hypothetical protein [Acinetobacter shaoyimingii]QIO05886.1 hypothetical protein G8E00_07940 [Acinetobacter shaoyimingii]
MNLKIFSLIFISIFILISCSTVNNKNEELNVIDKEVMDDFILNKKKELPKKIDCCTSLIDVYRDKNTLVNVYQLKLERVDDKSIEDIKNKHYLPPKVNEICNLVETTFDGPVELEYKILNVNNVYLFSLFFSKSKCKELIKVY